MKYDIKINYDTGDTFRHESDCETIIKLNCSLETATENLNRIKEHYTAYENVNGYNSKFRTQKEIKEYLKSLKSERWHTGTNWEFSIKLLDDDGNEVEKSTGTWVGYFERLNYGEVVPHNEELPRFDV